MRLRKRDLPKPKTEAPALDPAAQASSSAPFTLADIQALLREQSSQQLEEIKALRGDYRMRVNRNSDGRIESVDVVAGPREGLAR